MQSIFKKPIPKSNLYQSILDEIRQAIREGKLKAGDQLPSEREMAAAFGTSRIAVKQAIVAMEVSGLIEVFPGRGTYLRNIDLNTYLEPLAYLIYGTETSFLDVLELRIALETEAAALAAKRANNQDIRAIESALKAEESALLLGTQAIQEDINFHNQISQATHNQAICKVMYTIRELMNCSFKEQRDRTWDNPGRVELIKNEHRDIFKHIINQDSVLARDAMRYHLERVKSEMSRDEACAEEKEVNSI